MKIGFLTLVCIFITSVFAMEEEKQPSLSDLTASINELKVILDEIKISVSEDKKRIRSMQQSSKKKMEQLKALAESLDQTNGFQYVKTENLFAALDTYNQDK